MNKLVTANHFEEVICRNGYVNSPVRHQMPVIKAKKKAVSALEQEIEALIRQTNHIGKRYENGLPNNCKPSTIEGMIVGLSAMLEGYKGTAK